MHHIKRLSAADVKSCTTSGLVKLAELASKKEAATLNDAMEELEKLKGAALLRAR